MKAPRRASLYASLVLAGTAAPSVASDVDMLGPGLKLLWLLIFSAYCVPALLLVGAVVLKRRRHYVSHLSILAIGVAAAVITAMPRSPFPGSWDLPIVAGSFGLHWALFVSYLLQPSMTHARNHSQ